MPRLSFGVGRFAFAGLAALALSAAVAQEKPAQEVLFEDDFATLDPAWGQPTDIVFVKDEKFTIRPQLNTAWYVFYNGDVFEDMDASVKVRMADGKTPGWGGGLTFWGENGQNYYYLYTTADGQWSVGRYTRGKLLNVIPWRANEAIKKGIGETNELRVVTRGTAATVYVNGTELATFRGRPPKGGGLIGLQGDSGADSKNTWEFTHLKVLTAPPAPTPSASPESAPAAVARTTNKVPASDESAKESSGKSD
jgi:hypothetical protein